MAARDGASTRCYNRQARRGRPARAGAASGKPEVGDAVIVRWKSPMSSYNHGGILLEPADVGGTTMVNFCCNRGGHFCWNRDALQPAY